jgi:ubiquinone/menaquinone biosynthesis C-methylase UbiE
MPHDDSHDHSHDRSHADDDEADTAAMAELADLDAEVLHEYVDQVIAWVAAAMPAPEQVLDLGAGTGTGTVALAERFASAAITAIDASDGMLEHARRKIAARGLGERVRTLVADLDEGWPQQVPPADLVWASLSLHHMADPQRVLADVFGALRPGGVFALLEMGRLPRFLPDDLGIGRPGLEERLHDVIAARHAQSMPTIGTDWAPRLERAGFTPVDARAFPLDAEPPVPAGTARYALTFLRRARPTLDDRLAGDDLATLDTLLAANGPHSILRRSDLHITGSRSGWLVRKP